MSEYRWERHKCVPEVATERVRGAATGQQNIPVTADQFDRWLAAHDAGVLMDAAHAVHAWFDDAEDIEEFLKARATRLREGGRP